MADSATPGDDVPIDISVVTPSYRQSAWLKLCIASVADQRGVAVEHIVQDAGSDDGTLTWLERDARVRAFVERDSGMYDAVNRGIARARGGIVAYLNCDEQYLPGSLAAVARELARRPEIDVLFGDVLVVDASGNLVAQRRVVVPRASHVALSHLPTLSCAMFVRRSVFAEREILFDPHYKAIADARWVLHCIAEGVPMAVLRRHLAVFTQTGANLGAGALAKVESAVLRRELPRAIRLTTPLVVAHHRLRRLANGAYRSPAVDYDIYTRASPTARVAFHVARPHGTLG